jgi:hypothetical protein
MATGRILKNSEDEVTRRVNMKGQALQIATPPLLLKGESLSSNVTLNEILRSAKFVPVLVFIPAPVEGDPVSLHKALGEDSLAYIDGGRLTEVLKKGDGTPNAPIERATFAFGDAVVDFSRMEAFRKNEPIALTTLQFKLLRYLTRNALRVISRDELLNEVWGYGHYPTTRTVDNTILKLRQKLEPNPSRPIHLRTVHGTGYKFLP